MVKHLHTCTLPLLYIIADNELQAMVDELRESLNAIPCTAEPASVMKSWAERREQLEQSWESHRAKLFEEVVTSMALPPEAVCAFCILS